MKELLKRLIKVRPTLDHGELEAAVVLAEFFKSAGIAAKIDTWDQTRANIVVSAGLGQADKALVFLCHLDVVPAGEGPWTVGPFEAVEHDGMIFGRGAADMKAGLVCAASAIAEAAVSDRHIPGRLIFAATAGEETDSSGIKRFVAEYTGQFPPVTAAIIPEPTALEVVTAHRGILWVKITTKGKAAHSSLPALGVNAIDMMNKLLVRLESYNITSQIHPILGACSKSVNQIHGGKASNIVPDSCYVEIDFRTLPGIDYRKVMADINRIFSELKSNYTDFNAELEILRLVDALETDGNCDFVKTVCRVVGDEKIGPINFTTDGPYLKKMGCEVVVLGPGEPQMCHVPDEYVRICELEKAKRIYSGIIRGFFAGC